ncbi:hypothetical protein EVAR_94689_1 [Eumeta japonica]|uniref:Uncharacterized protein n=1 Tax=Eumeta variegata TaxID=151549 RepID=A0A4C1UW49_EUMVA|nr:hypothetical protein EVAR_94689_1 [Eumeta japonica]
MQRSKKQSFIDIYVSDLESGDRRVVGGVLQLEGVRQARRLAQVQAAQRQARGGRRRRALAPRQQAAAAHRRLHPPPLGAHSVAVVLPEHPCRRNICSVQRCVVLDSRNDGVVD